ncbi:MULTISPECIES: RnfABCDGE type electron transport complex subunit G [unclassified Agarivorans]|uniref:RnfABCDGE type electron transport complex subunit G n=1 Tax=unclassified Agarivorans TaxID=2636026 RepID=UPI0026E353C5|nr:MULTISPECIES: RnfABCDGE type electron transport complex subunit G [unclassified Agarivorans]MDO6685944.1 RnfABCDGE type electron transport complex subunit G [Agarivorans sp. 3_MG-2023]MDO6713918.1 RnfABCDGE type electron transport complex subunit G [Agarivorans sp. 2_MG-2023]
MALPCVEKHINSSIYQSLSLAFAVGISSALLLGLNIITEPAIAQRVNEDKLAAIDLVMPQQHYSNSLLATEQSFSIDDRTYTVYNALDKQQQASGYVVQLSAKGYAGPINLLVGVNAELSITGVRVLNHSETPGLGDKIELAKNPWILSFNDKSLANTTSKGWAVKKDGGEFDQFTGATITPRAVVNAVHQALLDLNTKQGS